MIALLFGRLALALALGALAMALLARGEPAQPLPLVKADFPVCVTIKPPPLLRSPDNAHDFRLGQPFNDKGTA